MKLEKYQEKKKERKGIVIFTLLSLFLVAGIYLYKSFAYYDEKKEFDMINGYVSDPGDLYFAFYIDGEITRNMPKSGEGYVFDEEKSSCTNGATPTLDEETWSIVVKNMTLSRTKCTIHFKKSN